jgi:hypothetical protein
LVKKYFAPIQARLVEIIRQGIELGYFRPLDPNLTVISLMGSILWYFIGSPVFRRVPGMENYAEENRANFSLHTWDIIFRGLGAD